MIEWFLFYGIHLGRDDFAVRMGHQFPFDVLADAAETEFGIPYFAVVVAQEADDFTVFDSLSYSIASLGFSKFSPTTLLDDDGTFILSPRARTLPVKQCRTPQQLCPPQRAGGAGP
jgi:hypothetical protein